MIFDFFNGVIAQSSPSSPSNISPSTDINLLAKQFDFFFRAVGVTFTGIAILLTIIGLLTSIFVIVTSFQNKKSLKDAIAEIDKSVKRQVNTYIVKSIEKRIESLERTVEKEEVIGSTIIKYIESINHNKRETLAEIKLLKQRGFKDVLVDSYPLKRDSKMYDVLVIDFFNRNFASPEEKEQEVVNIVEQVIDNLLPQSALVVYVSGYIKGLDNVIKNKQVYFTPANNPVSLIGRVVDSAQMAYALQHSEN